MSKQQNLNSQFEIQTEVLYGQQESRPQDNYHFFIYKITIKNCGAHSAQLMSRHWVITDSLGRTEEVRGAGVIGVQPKINANQTFTYESACPMTTSSGSMKGSYQFMAEDGNLFDVEIPEFYLIAPSALH